MTFMVAVHLFSAVFALILGVMLLAWSKGTVLHRHLGRVWMILMIVAALSAFGLSSGMLGFYFSPLHGLAVFTILMVWRAYRYARAGRISAHRKTVLGLFWGALVVPGIFAILLPGRFLNLLLLS